MSARRRFEQAKGEFQHTIRTNISDLEDNHGFSREHAVQSVLHEIVTYTGAFAPVDEEMVFQVMKQHGLCWEEALRALVVSRAVDQLAANTTCVAAAVQNLTQRLQQAELWKHSVAEIVHVTAASRGVPRILQPVPAVSGKPPVQAQDSTIIPTTKREKREALAESSTPPIPTEITAVADFDKNSNHLVDVSKNAAAKATRKRPADSSSVTSKPEGRKRAAKRSRELEEECSAKPSC